MAEKKQIYVNTTRVLIRTGKDAGEYEPHKCQSTLEHLSQAQIGTMLVRGVWITLEDYQKQQKAAASS